MSKSVKTYTIVARRESGQPLKLVRLNGETVELVESKRDATKFTQENFAAAQKIVRLAGFVSFAN